MNRLVWLLPLSACEQTLAPPSDARPSGIRQLTVTLQAADACINPCTFTADAPTASAVRYEADTWLLDSSADPATGFEVTYAFNQRGPRNVTAIALDGSGAETGRHTREVVVWAPGEVALVADDPCENPCTLSAVAGPDVAAVRYVADGLWTLGETDVRGDAFALTYPFGTVGRRSLAAVALDASGAEIGRDERVIEVVRPGDVCWLGADRNHTACADTVPKPNTSDYAYQAGSGAYQAPVSVIDLLAIDPQLRIAPSFTLVEIAAAFKGRYAVVQTHAVASLQDVRDDVGPLTVTSGYRSPGYNAGVGGASISRHTYGDGFDLYPSSTSLSGLGAACTANGAAFVQLYTGHVHCDWRADPLDPAFYAAPRMAGGLDLGLQQEGMDADVVWTGPALTAPAVGFDEGEPLRIWTAFDADGRLLEEVVAETYAPPAEAAEVEVEVGGALVRGTVL